MNRPNSFLICLFTVASAAFGQATCPALNFRGLQTIPTHTAPPARLDLIRQGDGSWTAFKVNDLDPTVVISATPHFEREVGKCLPPIATGSSPIKAPSTVPVGYTALPARIAPGKFLMVNGLQGSVPSGSSLPYLVLDSQHAVISSGVLNTPGTSLYTVGIAEVTGDANLDVIVTGQPNTDSTATSLWIFPGNGDGTFAPALQQTAPKTTVNSRIAVADVNGDGLPDVIWGDRDTHNIVLALGPAGSHFSVQTIPLPVNNNKPFGSFPPLAIADLNGDNHPDILLAGQDATAAIYASVLLGDGKGNFGSPITSGPFWNQFRPAALIADIAIGDLNEDGTPDLITNSGTILFGDGKGGFPQSDNYANSAYSGPSILDINNDGINDVLFGVATPDFVSGYQSLATDTSVMFGLGSGRFSGPPVTDLSVSADLIASSSVQMAAADFNGDGKSEIAVFRSLSVPATANAVDSSQVQFTALKETDDGRLAITGQVITPHIAGFRVSAAVSGDFNHDGHQDALALLTLDAGGSEIQFYAGRGDNTFNPPLTTVLAETADFLIASDLNGDGVPDLAGTAGNLVWVRLAKGDGTFGPITFSNTTLQHAIAFGDFNRDGKQDLAIAASDNNLTVMPGKGDGTFATAVATPLNGYFVSTSRNSNGLVTADVDGDGLLDIVLQSAPVDSGPMITFMLGNGDGTFRRRNTSIFGRPVIEYIAVADLNDDGSTDVITNLPYRGSATPSTFIMGNGDATLGNSLPGPTTDRLIIADVNGDGLPDLIGTDGHGVALFLNISAATPALTVFSGASFAPGPLAPGSFASAFGSRLSGATSAAFPGVVGLGGVLVSVQDAAGTVRNAALTYVSPEQINFIVPAETAPGPAVVRVNNSQSLLTALSAPITVSPVAPALFTVPGFNSNVVYQNVTVAAAYAIRVDEKGNQSLLSLFSSSGYLMPLDLTQGGTVYLALYGTGFDSAIAASTTASIEGVPARVTYAGPVPQMPGVDQINLLVPSLLAGKSFCFVSVAIGGVPANTVVVPIQ